MDNDDVADDDGNVIIKVIRPIIVYGDARLVWGLSANQT